MSYGLTDDYSRFIRSTCSIPSLPDAPLSYVLRQCELPEGIAVELGVYKGTTLTRITSRFHDKTHGFDSFEGLPERWERSDMEFNKGAFALDSLPVVEGAILHKGWFDQTLSEFVSQLTEKISLLHIDCDLYSSTKTGLEACVPHLAKNAVIVFDELLDYPNYEKNELLALYEYARDHKLRFDWIGKYGNVRVTPDKDRGPIYQSCAIRVLN